MGAQEAGQRPRTARRLAAASLAVLLLAQGSLLFAIDRGPRPAEAPEPRAPRLGVPVEIEDPSGHALDAFGAALRRAGAHQGIARVAWFGASHTAGDQYVGRIRERLQARFGDAGAGFVSPVQPFAWSGNRAARVRSGGPWRVLRVDRGPVGEAYGYAGHAVESLRGGSWGTIDSLGGDSGPHRVGTYEIFFLRRPGGGRFEVRIDDRPVAVVDTEADAPRTGYARFRVRDREHRIAVRALGRNPVRIFGVVLERDRSGVVVDTLGIPGSRARGLLRGNDGIYREHLRRRRPDLVVLAYGTNESEDARVPLTRYEADLRRVVRRVRQTVPAASCLLVGPSDRPIRQADGSWAARPLTASVVAVQRRVSRDEGCGFFDTVAFMGGPLTMPAWAAASPPYAQPDHVHLTPLGYERLAEVLGDDLVAGISEAP